MLTDDEGLKLRTVMLSLIDVSAILRIIKDSRSSGRGINRPRTLGAQRRQAGWFFEAPTLAQH